MAEHPLLARLREFPDFAELPDEAGAELGLEIRALHVAAGTLLATQGEPCLYFPLVLSGQARVFTTDEDGREVTLYRLNAGEGCVLAAACGISGEPLPGSVTVDAAGEGLFIPAPLFRSWVERHPFWRNYLFGLVARQLGQVVAITNELAFRRLDARIASLLVRRANGSGRFAQTHQTVALELGTRREVASRILKRFEQEGLVALERGAIQIRDRGALVARAGLNGVGDFST